MVIDRDLHVHTFFSPCADPAMSLSAILEAAAAAGVKDVGLTDHPYRPGLAHHHEHLDRGRRAAGSPVRVWIGAELEVLGPQRLVLSTADLPLADYIVAAPSHYDLINFPPVSRMDSAAEWADRLVGDMENVPGSGAHAIAHPFFVYAIVVANPPGLQLPKVEHILPLIMPRRLNNVLEKLAGESIALEISPRAVQTPAFAAFMEDFYRRARRMGIRFLIGSDSHRAATVGRLGGAAALVERLGLTPDDLWHPAMARRDTARSPAR
jgi:histidinol phosphatase-like PHP family hydrolase